MHGIKNKPVEVVMDAMDQFGMPCDGSGHDGRLDEACYWTISCWTS